MSELGTTVAAVIPCYRVKPYILGVLGEIGPECSRIYVVDDCCPDGTGEFVRTNCTDPRVVVLRNETNLGVGGAVVAGYRAAIADHMEIIVKLDGDGQMAPELVVDFIGPILAGEADYTKGNRFFDLEGLRSMPRARLFGNAALSFVTKLSSGYWDLFDPTNGYTAIHREVARRIPLDKLSNGYFFETDLLFRLNTLRAVVVDVPMDASYGDETSSLKISKIIGEFFLGHCRNFAKRIFYNYYLRDMSLASLELPLGLLLIIFGLVFGGYHWIDSVVRGIRTPAGTVMLAAVSLLMGLQFVLAFIATDISSSPTRVLHLKSRPRTNYQASR
ncbi:MAG TPA: glycosyltransferase family 2 protein [Gammaproteobacteria bacterium]|nr:glycosyltransferase family 2 protein [Gammaproteobacteria bacterium]